MRFIVYGGSSNPYVGGGVALGVLCDNIRKLGYQCDQTGVPDDETMVVYPEVIKGNPLGAKHVTRYILNTPGFLGGDGVFGERDLVYKFLDRFEAPDESRVNGLLHAYDPHLDLFRNRGGKRDGFCYTARHMGTGRQPIGECIDGYAKDGGHEYLADTFNRRRYFYSYCDITMISIFAALCGCISIVHPDGRTTPEEWRERNRPLRYGIAYGLEDIGHAVDTIHLVKDNMEEILAESIEQTKAFIRKSKETCSQS